MTAREAGPRRLAASTWWSRWIHSITASLALLLLTVPRLAWAAPPELRAELENDIVAVGEQVRLNLHAMAENTDVDQPDPGVPPSVRVEQTSMGPMHSVSIVNGVRSDRRGLRATYVLSATKVGTFRLTPSVAVGGRRVRATPVELRVVKAGQVPQNRPRGTGGQKDPFDVFKDPFGSDPFSNSPLRDLFGGQNHVGRITAVENNPSLAMVPAPRGNIAFLHARVDKPNAVVGEQITYSVYLFLDAEQAEPRFEDVHEAGTSEYLRQSILPEENAPQMLGHTMLGGRLWAVKLLRRSALFPLKAGHLAIAPMQLRISSGRTQRALRETEPLAVDVTEPPAQGRPPGMAVGDVGAFRLTGNVTPREVEAGGVVTVELELEGTGNLPTTLATPPRKGIEWLPPDVKSAIAPDPQGRIGGRRTFTYVVRMTEPGSVDLGEITLPFFNPESKRYDVARASLGSVVVRPGAKQLDAAGTAQLLRGLPKALKSPVATRRASESFVSSPLFWMAWLAGPLGALVFVAANTALTRLRARQEDPREDPRATLRAIEKRVDDALKSGDAKAADAAVAKLLESSVEQKTGLSVRGTPLHRLGDELVAAGVSSDAAAEIVRILGEAEAARFSPSGVAIDEARARHQAAKSVLARIEAKTGRRATKGVSTAATLTFLLAGTFLVADARAEDGLGRAAQALEQGKPDVAITELEQLADRGVVDPAISFDRGLAYADRVRLGGGQPGDLGRAVHGFEEARRLSGDATLRRDATQALQIVRTEIARQRARGQAVELESRTFVESVTALFDADGWGVLACLTSLAASVATVLALRWRKRDDSVARRLTSGALLIVGLALPLSLASIALAHERVADRTRTWAVVISPELRLSGPGRAPGAPLPEGAIVEITNTDAHRVEVRWGLEREWIERRSVRPLSF